MKRSCLSVFVLVVGTVPFAQAEDFPSRTITLVVPFAPGGAIDIVTRAMARKLTERFGKAVIVENRGGGGTVIGSAAVAKAAPDGYTLLSAPSALAIDASLYKELPFDPAKDFTPIVLVARLPYVLVINPSLPAHSVLDLITLAKEKPGQLAYASSGPGSGLHLCAESFKSMAGVDITHVPYRGGPPALSDVIAGHVQMMFADPGSALPQIKQGKVRALAVSSRTRLAAAPDIPTVAEAGVPGFESVGWQLILAPANVHEEIVSKLHVELKTIALLPDITQLLIQTGLLPVNSPAPNELRRFLVSEVDRWGKIVGKAGLAKSQ
jgi:tripartite-type tricarboxylate transporter receptor subunit TctC